MIGIHIRSGKTERESHVTVEAGQAKECQELPEAGRSGEDPAPEPLEAAALPAPGHLASRTGRINFCCLKTPCWWSFVTRALKTNIPQQPFQGPASLQAGDRNEVSLAPPCNGAWLATGAARGRREGKHALKAALTTAGLEADEVSACAPETAEALPA